MFIEVGKQVKVEDLIHGIIVQSGNDATIAAAEGLSGSEKSFAEDITDIAHELGMNNTNFANASGWPDPDHYSTARDLATLAAATIDNFPEYYHYFAEKEFTYNNIKQRNRNPLIYRNMGADGLKTGHTEDGGYGLIGSGKHKGRRVIIVVNGLQSEKDRAQESAKLLEWGLRRFTLKTLFEKDTPLADVPVLYGKEKTVAAILKDDITLSVPKITSADVTTATDIAGTLTAPIVQGQEIGTFRVTIPGQDELSYPLYAQTAIAEKNILSKNCRETDQYGQKEGTKIMTQHGLFISFEGGEGSGKTTQINRLADYLNEQKHKIVTTREPGGTPEAEKNPRFPRQTRRRQLDT